MAFRLLRICSGEENFNKRLTELKEEFLMPRGYKPKIIDGQFKRISELEIHIVIGGKKPLKRKKGNKEITKESLLLSCTIPYYLKLAQF